MRNAVTTVICIRGFVIVPLNIMALNAILDVLLIFFLDIIIFLAGANIRDDPNAICDDVFNKLDLLTNISPEEYSGDDYLFSRFKDTTIGAGDKAAYSDKPKTWISKTLN